jgi:hypothetical protein
MEEKLYCIVDNTIDSSVALEGLDNLTIVEAETWILEHQVISSTNDKQFSIEKHNWQEQD